jgi:succinoglycan biosynthesis transport protein ExoP
MLQISNHHSMAAAVPEVAAATSFADLVDLFFGLLRRQYLVILSCLILALGVGALYVLIAPSTYTAATLVMIESRTGQFLPERSVLGETQINSPWIDSQIAIIRSDDLLASVASNLELETKPEFVETSAWWRRWPFSLAGKTADSTSSSDTVDKILDILDKNLEVHRVGMSYVIEIRIRAHNPDLAAQIANGIATAYLTDQAVAKSDAGRRASDWLHERLQTLRQQSSAAERAVVEFKTKNNIVAAEGKLMNEQQLADLTARLVAARASTGEAEARLSQIETVIKADRPESTVTAVADSLSNPIITKLRTEYLELVNREAEWSARYGKKHQAVARLRDQLRDIRSSIHNELLRIAESYKSEVAIAKKRQAELEGQLAGVITRSQETNQAQITLRTLESAAQSYRTLYDNFLRRYTEAQQAFPSSEARVISTATPPSFKSHPRKDLVAAIAMLAGLALGFGLALFREMMDRAFRTSGQVQAAVSTECVAMVPRLRPGKAAAPWRLDATLEAVPRLTHYNENAVQAAVNSPLSPFAEAIRSIKLAADLSSVKVIGLVSSIPGEGKSTIAMALGELMVQSGARVVLVDCDLRNPSLSRALAPDAKIGLSDVIFGNESSEDAIWTDARTGMAFIPSIVGAYLPHTSDILASPAAKCLVSKLRSSYDYVVVDLSPLAAGVDARLTTGFIDAYVLVVKWGQTTVDVVQYALQSAQSIQESLLGVVLNQVDFRQLSRYDGHRAKYYYRGELA